MADEGEQERLRLRGAGRATTWPPRSAQQIVPYGSGFLPSLVETIQSWVRAEAGPGRLLPWVPVAFGAGIALYFAADREPVLAVIAQVALVFCIIAFFSRRQRFFPIAVMIAAIASGFATATWKSQRVAHTVLTKPVYSASLKGFVETHEERERTDRFVLRVEEMDARGQAKIDRVRLSVRKGTAPDVGSFVELKARLQPPLRWAGAALVVLATAWALATPRPDILISGDGQNVAARGKDGRFHVMRTAKDAFLVREWLAADADPRMATDATLSEGVSCDDSGCVTAAADGKLIALSLKPEALQDDCAQAAVVVTSRQPPQDCAALVLDQETLKRRGTLALFKTANGYSITAIRPRGVDRPWAPAVAEAEPDVPSLKKTPAQPVDATPAENDLQAED